MKKRNSISIIIGYVSVLPILTSLLTFWGAVYYVGVTEGLNLAITEFDISVIEMLKAPMGISLRVFTMVLLITTLGILFFAVIDIVFAFSKKKKTKNPNNWAAKASDVMDGYMVYFYAVGLIALLVSVSVIYLRDGQGFAKNRISNRKPAYVMLAGEKEVRRMDYLCRIGDKTVMVSADDQMTLVSNNQIIFIDILPQPKESSNTKGSCEEIQTEKP